MTNAEKKLVLQLATQLFTNPKWEPESFRLDEKTARSRSAIQWATAFVNFAKTMELTTIDDESIMSPVEFMVGGLTPS